MPPRICTSCPTPHETRDWYVIQVWARRGEIECAEAHERRVRLETRDQIYPHLNKAIQEARE